MRGGSTPVACRCCEVQLWGNPIQLQPGLLAEEDGRSTRAARLLSPFLSYDSCCVEASLNHFPYGCEDMRELFKYNLWQQRLSPQAIGLACRGLST